LTSSLAGLRPVGVIAEVIAYDGDIMRLPGLLALGQQKGGSLSSASDNWSSDLRPGTPNSSSQILRTR
jgi:3,4-dihydroxy-2-butanone 4-phosphate synthase